MQNSVWKCEKSKICSMFWNFSEKVALFEDFLRKFWQIFRGKYAKNEVVLRALGTGHKRPLQLTRASGCLCHQTYKNAIFWDLLSAPTHHAATPRQAFGPKHCPRPTVPTYAHIDPGSDAWIQTNINYLFQCLFSHFYLNKHHHSRLFII